MKRLPAGDDWRDHAVDCPHCKEPVLDAHEHRVEASHTDPGYWTCDHVEPEEE